MEINDVNIDQIKLVDNFVTTTSQERSDPINVKDFTSTLNIAGLTEP